MATGAGRSGADCRAAPDTKPARRTCGASFAAVWNSGVEILTIYAFSDGELGPPALGSPALMRILEGVIDKELGELAAEGVQLRHIGVLDRLPGKLQDKVHRAIELTKNNTRLIVNIAFNYGGRDEIVHAVQAIIRDASPPRRSPKISSTATCTRRACPTRT
jgi:undecaprenyl diphosphate synthase